MTEIVTIEVNCPNEDIAVRIAEALLARRLAAAANIHAPIASLYHWRGRIERAAEVPLVLKTRADLFEPLATAARALHPYQTPSILAQPVTNATEDFRAWVLAETEGAG